MGDWGNPLEDNRQDQHGDHGQPGTAGARVYTGALRQEHWVCPGGSGQHVEAEGTLESCFCTSCATLPFSHAYGKRLLQRLSAVQQVSLLGCSPRDKRQVGQGLTFSLDIVQMLKYFLIVWVLPRPNLQHRDPTITTRTGAEWRPAGDGSANREVSLPVRSTLSQ